MFLCSVLFGQIRLLNDTRLIDLLETRNIPPNERCDRETVFCVKYLSLVSNVAQNVADLRFLSPQLKDVFF